MNLQISQRASLQLEKRTGFAAFRNHIGFKLNLVLTTVVTVTLLCFSAYNIFQYYQRAYTELSEQNQILINKLKHSLVEDVWNYAEESARATLDAELTDPSVMCIMVWNDKSLMLGRARMEEGAPINVTQPCDESSLVVTESLVKQQEGKNQVIGKIELFRDISPIEEKFRTMIVSEIAQVFLLDLVLILMIYLSVNRFLISRIDAMCTKVAAIVGKDTTDLTQRLPVYSTDELSGLATYINYLLDNTRELIEQLHHGIANLRESADDGATIADFTSQEISEQESELAALVQASSELSNIASQLTDNASHAASAALKTDEQTTAGNDVVERTIEAVKQLVSTVHDATVNTQQVNLDSTKIGSVVDVIQGVAEQTNLLALNAAIEAARANEQGRGFAVVAQEVRKLAQRTQESTREIREMVQRLQDSANQGARVMEQGAGQASDTIQQASDAGAMLNQISSGVSVIRRITADISGTANEQKSLIDAIRENIDTVRRVTQISSDQAKKNAETAGQLRKLADNLEYLVNNFKVTS
jgi:methyl-accepting chemotaxis protein